MDFVFQTKPLKYASKKTKYFYATAFLSGILQYKWVTKDQKIKTDPDQDYNYSKFKFFLQKHKLPAHVWTATLIICIALFQQQNNQLVLELIAYLNKLEI